MQPRSLPIVAIALVALAAACSSSDAGTTRTPTNPLDGPPAGYPDGHAPIPPEGEAEDVSLPTTVIGTGTPASCTGDAFVAAVANGGVITFDCGPDPLTIVLASTAKVLTTRERSSSSTAGTR